MPIMNMINILTKRTFEYRSFAIKGSNSSDPILQLLQIFRGMR